MNIEILTSIQDQLAFINTKAYLQSALKRDVVRFLDQDPAGKPYSYTPPPFVFNTIRVYDFARSARARIRNDVSTYLNNVLPGLQMGNYPKIRALFECLFNHYEYEEYFNQNNQHKSQLVEMLIFNHIERYVAHVYFKSTSSRTWPSPQYTVIVALTCHRYTYFPLQATNYSTLDAVRGALENLHLADISTQLNTQARWITTQEEGSAQTFSRVLSNNDMVQLFCFPKVWVDFSSCHFQLLYSEKYRISNCWSHFCHFKGVMNKLVVGDHSSSYSWSCVKIQIFEWKPYFDQIFFSWVAGQFFVFMWRHHFPKLKITNPPAVLVSSDVRPSNDLTFCNVSTRQGFSIC